MKNKKGFTLVEVLAVIIVLAIILLIAIPMTKNIIQKIKKGSLVTSLKQLNTTICADAILKDMAYYTIDEKGKILRSDGTSLKYKGKLCGHSNAIIKTGETCGHIKTIDGIICDANSEYCVAADTVLEDIDIKEVTKKEVTPSVYSDVPESCFTYAENSNDSSKIDIIGYDDICAKNPIIPEKLNGKTVIKIGGSAFHQKNLVAVKIADSVITIDSSEYGGAFYKNKIKNVYLGKNLENIELSAFAFNELTTVIFPDGIKKIGEGAFRYNKIQYINFPTSLKNIGIAAFNDNKFSDSQAFFYKVNNDGSFDYTTVISYAGERRENIAIPNTVLYIGERSFQACDLIGSIIIPDNVIEIGLFAFGSNPKLSYVEIGRGVNKIDKFAFAYSGIQDNSVIIKKLSSNVNISPDAFINNGPNTDTTIVPIFQP